MMITSPLKLQTDLQKNGMRMLLLIFGVYWLVALAALIDQSVGVALGIKVFIGAACILLAIQGMAQATALTHGARVLRQMQTPHCLWREWINTALSNASRTWGILAAGGTVLLALPASPWRWATAAALLSTILCLVTIRRLSNYGLLPQYWSWIISLGVIALVVIVGATVGIGAGIEWFGASPIALQLPLALSWPLLAHALARKWHRTLPPRTLNREQINGFWRRINNYAQRFTILRAQGSFQESEFAVWGWWGRWSGQLTIVMQLLISIFLSTLFLPTAWHATVGPYQLLWLGLIVIILSNSIVCKDLHWRMLLVPGGLQRERIGSHLFSVTLTIQFVVALALVAIGIAVSTLVLDLPLVWIFEKMQKFIVLPLEMLFTVSLAVSLRSFGRPVLTMVIAHFLLSLYGGAMFWKFGSEQPTWFSIGPISIAVLLLTSIALIILSNRLWTTKKLFAFSQLCQ